MRSGIAALLFGALLGSALSSVVRKEKLDVGDYRDDFARYQMLSLSAAAYADDPSKCLTTAFPKGNASISKIVEVVCDMFKTDSCRGFTAISHSAKAVIISFRGTAEFLQLAQEAIKTVIFPDTFIAGGKVSRYFYEAYKKVWESGLKDDYLELRNKYPDYEIWVTGHSLGGAMASLCAATLVHLGQANPEKLKLLTFGAPRIGDKAFVDVHEALVLYSYRVVHNRDIVPHVPPEFFPDSWLLDGYLHTKSEVWYANDMSPGSDFIVCNSGESWWCSDRDLITLSISDHLHYFQHEEMMPDFGEDGCPIGMLQAS
ncbi:hypothetical protein L596_010165 [Steinernema carpocapsae]|uniref:Fungal lipase-type domain-containing protein n=1 Tax=Steinernema carpocapsae TaxID=34508 RepID=A0A4U5PHI8_STECR|nr:hypothetical protein L596_010165 [Steinernema carpocapsae]